MNKSLKLICDVESTDFLEVEIVSGSVVLDIEDQFADSHVSVVLGKEKATQLRDFINTFLEGV